MLPTNSLETQVVAARGRRWRVVGLLALFAVMLGMIALLAVAYAQQSQQVDEVKAENQEILSQHKALGATFAEQSKKFVQQSRKFEKALRASFAKGLLVGRRASDMPLALRKLAGYAAAGMLVPARLPTGLKPDRPRINASLSGYTLRWGGLALFASRADPTSVWTRQALGAIPRPTTLGSHRVTRLTGPSGVIYVWHEKGATYAVLTLPRYEAVARSLIAAMR
jgi:nitrogen fixation-related uncharacterized protein